MKKLLLFSFFILGACSTKALEQIDLTSPFVVNPTSTTFFRVDFLAFDRPGAKIYITVSNGSGVSQNFNYTGSIATNMMNVLNKANLSTNSLHKRVLNQLISDGKLSGTVSGNPD